MMFHGTWRWQGGGYDVWQYDHTIKKLPENHERFHWSRVGICGIENDKNTNLRTLQQILRENDHGNLEGAVLKMDVEGYEYEVFSNMSPEILNSFDQIVLEVHMLNNPWLRDSIITAFKRLADTHRVVHVHANNLTGIRCMGDIVMPHCLELTYLKKDWLQMKRAENRLLPIPIDQPCQPYLPEIQLGNW